MPPSSRPRLSHRYISDRFLPDKAVDLVDEAASRLKIELDSMPTEIDVIEREIMQQEMERQALKKEKDAASKERLKNIEKELADLKEQSSALKAEWQKEKSVIDEQRKLKEQLEQRGPSWSGRNAAANCRKASELQYGRIPELEQKLAEIEREDETERQSPLARRGHGRRHRAGRVELDRDSGLAFAGRRTGEAGQDGGASA